MTDHDKASPQGPDIDRAIQRHASAYVARGAAISDSITAECIAARDALRTMFTSAAESRQEIRTTGDSLESLSLLADAVWRARETFLDAVGTLNQEGCRQKLAEVLWNDKGGIALALRELVDRRRLDAVPAAKQNISDEMVQAGAKALNPLAFELDEYGDYTAMPAARCDARTEARQAIVAALRAAPNPSPADSELEALKHDIERLTETNSQLLAQVEETTSKLDDMTDLLKQFVYAYEEQDADNFTDSLRSAYAAADAALSSTEGDRHG